MKIMFFANDPGGANAIFPLIESLKKNNEVFVFAKLAALQILKCPEYNNQLSSIMPDLIITGTSAKNSDERYLWKEAKDLGIKSIAILDYWGNYGIRFSKYSSLEIEKFNNVCECLPDYIIVMDEFAKSEAIKEGIPEEIILPLGNPHFENMLNQSKTLKDVRSKFASKDEFLITYASQPFIEDCGKGEELNVLEDLIALTDKKIIVKIHPKEDFSKFDKYKSRVQLDKLTPILEVFKASDLVISINSMALFEAMIIQKPVISYQKNEHDKNKFILTKLGQLPFINNKKDFASELRKKIDNPKSSQYNDFINYNSIKSIQKFIEEVYYGKISN